MSTGLQTEPKLSQLIVREDTHDRIVAAIGDTMPAEQFISHALVAFQAPEVRKCTPRSQLVAFMELAALGLLPTLNQAKLIPYKDEIKVMPQWQGFKALMERNKAVLEVQAFLVHVLDQFTYTARDGTLHVMDPFNPERQFRGPKDIRGGYLRITYRDGRPPRYHFVPVAQIEKCRGCAQTQNVWTKWYEQMALKTIYRDGYARRAVPMDPLVAGRMEKLLEADDALLGNDPARIETTPLVDRIRRQREAAQNPAGPQTTDGHGAVENDADTEAANGPSGTTPPVTDNTDEGPSYEPDVPADAPEGWSPELYEQWLESLERVSPTMYEETEQQIKAAPLRPEERSGVLTKLANLKSRAATTGARGKRGAKSLID